MNFPPDELEELKELGPLSTATEGGRTYLLLQNLALPEGCTPSRVDVLLCPSPRDGYPSRLFFAQRVATPARAPNWNGQMYLLDRAWYAFSWKVSEGPRRLAQLLAEHLRGLR